MSIWDRWRAFPATETFLVQAVISWQTMSSEPTRKILLRVSNKKAYVWDVDGAIVLELTLARTIDERYS